MEALGNISVAAESLKVVRNTLVKWVDEEDLKDVVVQARNARLDFAESKLDQNIKNGDTTAIIFLLKTLGKERGYVERQESKIEVDKPIFTGIDLNVPEDNSTG